MKTIHLIAAARPNFMKVAPLYHRLKRSNWAVPMIVHTGQHYDYNMSGAFFEQLSLPAPDFHLGVGSGSHAEQAAGVMVAYERLIQENPPDLVVVVGDVNSTMACSLAAVKLGRKIAHLEAGLRSFDRSMPEEINRIVTDAVSHLLLTPSEDADQHLLREGISPDKIVRVGNIMIDSLEMMRPTFEGSPIRSKLGLDARAYGLVTLHRPSNVDSRATLAPLMENLGKLSEQIKLLFPVHPRTKNSLTSFGLLDKQEKITPLTVMDPLGYVDFMALAKDARLVITDSGGIQEEATHFGVPCLTLRENTERPITVLKGTNKLVRLPDLLQEAKRILHEPMPSPIRLTLWDGKTAERVEQCLRKFLS